MHDGLVYLADRLQWQRPPLPFRICTQISPAVTTRAMMTFSYARSSIPKRYGITFLKNDYQDRVEACFRTTISRTLRAS